MLELTGVLIIICIGVILFFSIIIPILIVSSIFLVPFLIYVYIDNIVFKIKMKFRRRKKNDKEIIRRD